MVEQFAKDPWDFMGHVLTVSSTQACWCFEQERSVGFLIICHASRALLGVT